MNRVSERGSAIMMLFLAIGLFAALAYAFMQGSRTSANVVTNEKAKSNASEIVAYANDLRMAVKRLKARGCTDEQISMKNDIVAGYDNTNNPPTTCEVFNSAGGAMVFKKPIANDGSDWMFTSINRLHSPTTYGNDNTDLIAVLGGLDTETCKAINQLANIGTSSSDGIPKENDYFRTDKYVGTYSTGGPALSSNAEPGIWGKTFGCIRSVTASPPADSTQPDVLYFFSALNIR